MLVEDSEEDDKGGSNDGPSKQTDLSPFGPAGGTLLFLPSEEGVFFFHAAFIGVV